MLKIIMEHFKSMEIKIKKIMHYGFTFSFFVCLLSLGVLIGYEFHPTPDLFYIGISIFKLGLFFVVEFIICALAVDTIKKEIS